MLGRALIAVEVIAGVVLLNSSTAIVHGTGLFGRSTVPWLLGFLAVYLALRLYGTGSRNGTEPFSLRTLAIGSWRVALLFGGTLGLVGLLLATRR